MQYVLPKAKFDAFIKAIMVDFEFVGPVKGDPSKKIEKSQYTTITNPDDIHFDINTYFPAKYLFFDKQEVLFTFKGNEVESIPLHIPDRVLYGLRKCDLNAIRHQDIVFLEENPDPFYKARRDATILIGMHCKEGDEFCFCNSFKHEPFFDVMMYDKGLVYAMETGSKKGEDFLKKFSSFLKREEAIHPTDRITINRMKLSTTDIKHLFAEKFWEDLSDTCISCGACTNLCPTCHCFSIKDEVCFDLKSGKRVREPASCQLRSFTRVAGDFVFRNKRVDRFKHRIYHQLQYYKDRHGMEMCTGCGRCIRGCPVKIDWVKAINENK